MGESIGEREWRGQEEGLDSSAVCIEVCQADFFSPLCMTMTVCTHRPAWSDSFRQKFFAHGFHSYRAVISTGATTSAAAVLCRCFVDKNWCVVAYCTMYIR